MARYDKALLNGRIESMEFKGLHELHIGLLVKNPLQKRGGFKFEKDENGMDRYIPIRIRQPEYIKYIMEKDTEVGDMMSVKGIYCTIPKEKTYTCPHCGEQNILSGTGDSYIHPLFLQVYEHPKSRKHHETVTISDTESFYTKEDINEIIYQRKKNDGNIVRISSPRKNDDGSVSYDIVVRKKLSNKDLDEWFDYLGKPCNRVILTGNLIRDPDYHPEDDKAGRICSYRIGIRRKYFVKEDSPEILSDFPFIKSLGNQAEKDFRILKKGSGITIDGYLQARNNFIRKITCSHCGKDFEVKDSAMEAVASHVTYDVKCDEAEEEDLIPNEMNRASVNGRIEVVKYIPDKENAEKVILGVMVKSKRTIAMGNKTGSSTNHATLVMIERRDQIEHLRQSDMYPGDFVSAEGFLCSVSGHKKTECPFCGTENILENISASYVSPEALFIYEHDKSKKRVENIRVSSKEKEYSKRRLMEILKERSKRRGDIIDVKDFIQTDKKGNGIITIIVREDLPDSDLISWLEYVSESSNESVLLGLVRDTPEYTQLEKYENKKCTYMIETKNSDDFLNNDKNITDFRIVSTGEQADNDHMAIKKKSVVTAEGYMRFRNNEGNKVKCRECGKEYSVKTYEIETVPYSVEYNSGCEQIEKDDDLDVIIPPFG